MPPLWVAIIVSEGQQFVGKFSREIGTEHFLVSWSDMQEFRSIPPTSYRNAEALKVI